jgi:hypothetical protein
MFMSKVVKYIIYREIIHNLGYFLWSSNIFHNTSVFGNVVVEYHLSCIMKQTSVFCFTLFK